MLFYKAFARYEYGDEDKRYSEIASLFSEASKTYMELRDYFIKPDTPNIINRYYDNSIAQCYSEIILCCIKCNGKLENIEAIKNYKSLEQFIEEAKKYTYSIDIGDSVGHYSKVDEKYYKNKGLLYERIARLMNDESEYEDNLKKAIEYYEKAAIYGSQKKTHYVLCSAYYKLLKELIRKNSKKDYIAEDSRLSVWTYQLTNNIESEEFKSYILKYNKASRRAREMWPSDLLYRWMTIMADIFTGIIDKDKRNMILKSVNAERKAIISVKLPNTYMEREIDNAIRNINEGLE